MSQIQPTKNDSAEDSIGERILQKYREGDSISNFFRSLTFDFATSLIDDQFASTSPDKARDFTQKRINYHRMKESVRDQIVWAAAELSKMYLSFPAKKPHDFKIGIILSDILPETGEFDCKMVVHGLLSALSDDGPLFSGNQIVILGRRDDLSEWVNRKFPGVQIVHEWERNVKITANLSFIVLLGSAMHLTLIEEQLRGHDMSKTVLMPVLMGISVTRISTLLKSTMIITPNFNSEEEFSGDEKPQNVTWNQADIVKGASFPDLDLFRAVSTEWCQCNGLDEASLQAILDHIPTTKSAAMELFQQFNLSRMYSVLLD